MDVKSGLEDKVSDYIGSKMITIDENESVVTAAKVMREEGQGFLLVTRKGEPGGILTESDVLYKVVAAGRDPNNTRISSVMSSPLHTVDYTAKVGDAISLMVRLKVRRLAVVKDGKIIGVVTQSKFMSGERSSTILLPELSKEKDVKCPYCGALFPTVEQASAHIDSYHVGKGLLEGDTRRW
jgi:signal-transduction protein with cAMP-binding, CBS, and nucleotidyltransferase domain